MDKFLTYIFGICSFLGFVITCVMVNTTLNKIKALEGTVKGFEQLTHIYLVLSGCILSLVLLFVLLIFFYSRKVTKLTDEKGDLPLQKQILEDHVKNRLLLLVTASECVHSILHYHRNILCRFDDFLEKGRNAPDTIDKDELTKTLTAFDYFLLTLLANLRSYFYLVTQDRCPVCIKIVNEEGRVRTFFRDSVSYGDRRRSDYNQDGTPHIYSVDDNYAFMIITGKTFKQTTFLCDNLKEFPGYYNRNPDWEKLYNACAVVPIRCQIGRAERNESRLFGFLCVDNFKGAFEVKEVEKFLAGFGDILYNVFIKYDEIVPMAIEKGVSNERLETYAKW